MKPILWQIGPLKIHAFGLFLALAFLFAGWLATRRGMKHGFREEDMVRWVSWILVTSIAGARIYYVLLHPERFAGRWGDVIAVWKGGLVIHGGIIAAVLFSYIYVRKVGWRLPALLDVAAPGLAFGEAIGRIGCLFNGCCYGKPSSGPLALAFPEGCAAHNVYGGEPLHPTQIYLVVLQGLLGLVLLRLDRGRGLFSAGRGALFGAYLVGTAALRIFVDVFRYYTPEDRWLLGLAHSQLIALVLAVAGFALILRGRSAGRRGSEVVR